MKKYISVAVFAMGIICLHAQGFINFQAVQKVFMPDGSLAPKNTLADFLVGTDASSLVPIVEGAPSVGVGSWVVGQTTIPGVPHGTPVFVQMRAWLGAPDFRSAVQGGQLWGESTVQESGPLGAGLGSTGPVSPIDAFTLIPEPRIIALTIFGIAVLIFKCLK